MKTTARTEKKHLYQIAYADGLEVRDWAASKAEVLNNWGFYAKQHGTAKVKRIR